MGANTARNNMGSRTHKGRNRATATDSSETETPNEVMFAVEFLGPVYLVVVTAAVQSDLW